MRQIAPFPLCVFCAFFVFCAFAAPALAGGPPPADDDWPCAQRRTGAISRAAVWSGPDSPESRSEDEAAVASLARKLASRRTPMDEAETLIDNFANEAGADKDKRLTRVFDSTLELINNERDKVISGILRYARGQKILAAKVREEADKVSDAQENAEPIAPDELEKAHPELKWDKRIFDDRARALTYVCETPVLLEKRAFAIAQALQRRL
ncbi:hypothetical protein [Rhodoblastus sp.]|uniref:hypothetical protein n=1 Tax=Rhodoblastus sp. TaxID=1962975 RepID=UPI003F96F42C